MSKGKVYLVGAGPSDPGLFTLRGQELLQSADVVVYDALVGQGILSLIPPDTRTIYAGKRAGHHSFSQTEINSLLVKEAKAGYLVVRLKGGDPFLFGRGGEELEELILQDIPFEVVPGVPSAIAVPAYGGIPVTHRGASSSLHILTAHTKEGLPKLDFAALTRLGGTLVFLMGVSALNYLCEGLMAAGMEETTPAAMIQNGTTASQRQVISTLKNLPQDCDKAGLSAPAVIVIGQVCGLSERFDWGKYRPLNQKRILVTRPLTRASSLSRALRQQGAEVIEFPCIRTKMTDPNPELIHALTNLHQYRWLAFTSPAGVEYFMQQLRNNRMDTRCLHGVQLAAIGSATARALEEKGLLADFVPEEYSAAQLGEGLAERAGQNDKILLARAKDGSPDLPAALTAAKVPFDEVILYETVYETPQAEQVVQLLRQGALNYLTFTSASTVRGFVQAIGEPCFSNVTAVCIGQATETEAKKYAMKTVVSKQASIESMVQCLIELERR